MGVIFQGTCPSDLFPPARAPCSRISNVAPPCGDKHSTHQPAREISDLTVAPASLWLEDVRVVLRTMVSLLSGGSEELLDGCSSSFSLVL